MLVAERDVPMETQLDRGARSVRALSALRRMPASGPFDVGVPGTDEAAWLHALRDAPRWEVPQGPVIVASPHPDDETLAAGGLIALAASLGHPVTVVSVSDGEAAYRHVADLAAVRRSELDASMRALGGEAVHVVRLGLPDGGLADRGEKIAGALTRLCEVGPVTLVAPLHGDGHPDHDAVARAAELAAACTGASLLRYAVWGWHRGIAHMAVRQPVKLHLDETALAAKRDAIRCFGSQLGSRFGAPVVPPHVLAYFQRDFEVFFT